MFGRRDQPHQGSTLGLSIALCISPFLRHISSTQLADVKKDSLFIKVLEALISPASNQQPEHLNRGVITPMSGCKVQRGLLEFWVQMVDDGGISLTQGAI